jgi:orotidine-5'-phosphate decarboxylase
MKFAEKLARAVKKNNSLLCVGLDPDIAKIPEAAKSSGTPLFDFNKAIIDATADQVCVFKPNSAFYEASGESGIAQLKQTCAYIQEHYPDVPILLDFKRGDIGNTNSFYAQFAFDYLGVDAVTVQPYMGRDANQPYLSYKDKGIFVLCRTSNPGAGEIQDLEIGGKKIYQIVAEHVINEWNEHGNCSLVMGSPYPEELTWARQTFGDEFTFLVPGAGTQGGEIEKTIKAGVNSQGTGLMINSSRQTLYASSGPDFAEAARAQATKLKDEINKYR